MQNTAMQKHQEGNLSYTLSNPFGVDTWLPDSDNMLCTPKNEVVLEIPGLLPR
jgi:hypothetical protein